MAKVKKAKVRTTAQRRAAAKAAWALRRLRGDVPFKKSRRTKNHVTSPPPAVDYGAYNQTPTSAVATREGDELYVTVSSGGSVHRHQLSRDTMRKLGLDCLQLVG